MTNKSRICIRYKYQCVYVFVRVWPFKQFLHFLFYIETNLPHGAIFVSLVALLC